MHMMFKQIADELNNQGVTLEMALQGLSLDITETNIKDMFRSIGMAKFNVSSTSELDTKQVQECYDEMVRHFAKLGIETKWPNFTQTEEYLNSYNDIY